MVWVIGLVGMVEMVATVELAAVAPAETEGLAGLRAGKAAGAFLRRQNRCR